jgi:hypothetical protein
MTLQVAPAAFTALFLAQLTALPAAAGAEPLPVASTAAIATVTPAKPASLPVIGVMTDAGLPDGLTASLVVRPAGWLRLHGGGSYNMISPGIRAGLTLVPFGWGPSLSVEGGHYFDGDANNLVRRFAGSGYQSSAALERVGYDYANAHLGLDFGARRVTFYIHGGMSYIRATVHQLDDVVQTQTASSAGTQVSIKQDPVIRAFTPSVKLGLIVYLW